MRLLRHFAALLIFSILASLLATTGPVAFAQSAEDAKKAADEARQRADTATGLVDEAVANREDMERQLADSITRMNELAAQLSLIGSQIDSISAQVGFADVELAGIQADIEDQAVDTYMTIVASPSFSVVNSDSVEEVMVASSVVQDVVADGRLTVSELFARRKGLEELKTKFLDDQEQYQSLQAEVDAEVEHFTSLYDQADAKVASAIRAAQAAEAEYLAALSDVDKAKAKEAERQRQESRDPATTTTTTTTGSSSPPTTAPQTTTTTSDSGGSGGPGDHPPAVEQWRSLVQQFFPSGRVEEALTIIDCESNGDPNAVNPYSGASGLFQFLPATWATTAPSAGYGGYSVFDPEANVASAAWLAGRYQALGYDYWQAWNCKRLLN